MIMIGIVGNYGNDNSGDDAILEGIIVQLENEYNINRKDIIVFSNNPEQTREKYNVQSVNLFQRRKSDVMKFIATVIHNRPIIKQLDLLIIGGGGILMDLYRNNPIVYGMYGLMTRLTNTPTIIYGAGAGPINTRLGKSILNWLVNGVDVVTVRDPESKKLLHSIGVKKDIHVITDPAFFVNGPKQTVRHDDQFHIGVTAVPYYNKSYWPVRNDDKYNNYVRGMAESFDRIIANNDKTIINFFSTKHPYDTEVTKHIQQLMTYKENTTLCDQMLTFDDVLRVTARQDLVIGTRLHSIILAIVTNTPVLAVSYHPKVKDFMDSVGYSRYVIPIEQLHDEPDFFNDLIIEMTENWEQTEQNIKQLLLDLKSNSPSGVQLMKDIFPK